MSNPTLEERIAALETEVNRLKLQQPTEIPQDDAPWWKKIVGVFKDDPEYDEAMRLGREYRESLRPQDEDNAGC